MQSRFIKTLLLATVIVAGLWILVNRDKIRKPQDILALLTETVAKQSGQPNLGGGETSATQGSYYPSGFTGPNPVTNNSAPHIVNNVVRVASFKLNRAITVPQGKASLDLVADICRRYDAIAFQEIDSRDNSWLGRLTDRMNQMGAAGTSNPHALANNPTQNRQTDYHFISDRGHNPGSPTQSAIVFNRQTLQLDQSKWYTVNDPDNLLSRKPIVAWFRARGPNPQQALTFTLANIKIDPARSEQELFYLGQLFRAIRNDGRGEDDVLIVGDFNAGDQGLQPIKRMNGLTWVVSNHPTDTKHKSQFDNLVFNETATVEFTGRGGVFDFMRFYNLRLEDALQISNHMPVWAEFSIFEGMSTKVPRIQGTPGRVAESALGKKKNPN